MPKQGKKRSPTSAALKKAAFVREYLVDMNATQAARRAGYAQKSARQAGARLMSDAAIMTEIQNASAARAERVIVTADEVLRKLLHIADVDLADLYDEHGNLKNIHDIPEATRRAMAGIEVDELWEGRGEDRTQVGVTRKVKLWDKPRALELLGKHLKLFTEVHEHRGLERLAEEYRQAEARVAGRQ